MKVYEEVIIKKKDNLHLGKIKLILFCQDHTDKQKQKKHLSKKKLILVLSGP